MAVLYEDEHVVCDDDAITIHDYYFPMGDKRIPYRDIRKVDEHAMGALTGKWRIWGSGDLRHWFHLDWRRPAKDKALVLSSAGWVRPVITPDDPARVLAILRDKTAA